MSYHIKVNGWTGQDQGEATARFARVFRMSGESAAGIMRDILRGNSWQFEQTVSPEQSEEAGAYLEKLGYQVGLIPAVEAQPVGMNTSIEPLTPPPEGDLPRKSFFDFAEMKKPDLDKANVENPATEELLFKPREKPDSSKALQLILLLLLGAAAALPYFFGMRAEAILNDLMPQLFRKDVIIQLKSYEIGWLRSTAEYDVKAKDVSPFTVASKIIHGPVSVDELLAGKFSGEYFQARINSEIKLDAMDEDADPLENVVKRGYFLKSGPAYKMDLVIKDQGLIVNGILILLPPR